ncbi:MAG TPA: tetratricopeptide repeat protein [Streptosporangiaceae bacterium]|nr:tetratricopeptide repeat protein [Streptosporangiaceae bacterium]
MAGARSAGTVADFCAGLRQLRAGSRIPVAVLAGRLGISRQHLHEVLAGRVKRPPDWDELVAPLVEACTEGDLRALASWRRRHEVLLEVWGFQGRSGGGGPVEDFCAGLRQLRTGSGIPVAVLAGRLGISRQHLYAVLGGRVRRVPEWDTMVRPLVEECTGGNPAAAAAWRRRHDLMTAAWEQLRRDGTGAPVAGAVRPGVRSSLPPDTAAFTGRDAELELITAAVAEAQGAGGRVAIRVIDGMPGVGKTALAVHAAHRLAAEFPDRQLFADLHGHTPGREPVTPLEALAGLLAATGADPRFIPADVEGRAGMWRDRMAGQRAVLVLDNAASSAQVTPLLPGAAGCLVLVTSRRHLADLPGPVISVLAEVLPDDAAVRMFTRLAPRAAADDPAAVADLTRLAGSLPLAVSLLARVYARHRSWSLADLAAQARAQLLTLAAEQVSVAAAFEVSVAHLERAWQEFFGCLGLHPGTSFDARAAAALTGVPLAESERLLDVLHGEGLLIETACRRYGMHDLIRRYSRDRAGQSMTAGDQRAAVGRLLDYYQRAAGQAQTLITLTDDGDALAWLRAERASLLACLDHASAGRMAERVVALTAGISELLRRDGPSAEAVARQERAVRTAAALADGPGQAGALRSLADAHWADADFPAAAGAATRALALFGELGDRLGEASASVLLAETQRLTGDYAAAARLLVRALGVFGELGDLIGQAKALLSLGVVRRLTGDCRSAATAARQALILSRELGRQRDHAQALVLVGDVRRDTGDYPGAIAAAEQALRLYREVGDRNGEACALWTLGGTQRAAGDYPAAISSLARTLAIWKEVGHRYCRASTLTCLGAVRRETGDYPAAAALLGEALQIFLDNGDRGGAAETLTETGALHLARGELTAARHCYARALDLAREIGSPADEETALAGLGRCQVLSSARR